MLELALRFLLIGAIAFGGGQAALPLVERMSVEQTGWLSSAQFAAGVGLAYITPGPVLILSAFVGYAVAGIPGGLLATGAVFLIPFVLATGVARLTGALADRPGFRVFARFAGAAAIGLLGVTLWALIEPLLRITPLLLIAAAAVAGLAARGVAPLLLLGFCAAAGALIATL